MGEGDLNAVAENPFERERKAWPERKKREEKTAHSAILAFEPESGEGWGPPEESVLTPVERDLRPALGNVLRAYDPSVDVVFVIGLAIELAGAALLAAGQIRLVDRTIATRGMVSPRPAEPRREAQRESARFTTGFALLAVGVVVQLFGYAIDGGWWLLGLAVGVVVLAAIVGRVIADEPVTSWLHGKAVAYWSSESPRD